MPKTPRILAFAGSARKASFNKQLVAVAANGAKKAGANVTLIDLKEYPLPIYDGDVEEESGLPENARKLKALFLSHDGLLIASPEYNSSISPLLKNVIDWVSRQERDDEPALAAYKDKVVTLLSASPGAFGGLRGLIPLRSILGNIGVLVLPNQFALAKCHEAFNPDGSCKDPKQQAHIEKMGADLASFLSKLQG